MMKYDNITVMKAISICFKPFLKSEEAMIYCNLGRTQLTKKCEEHGVFKNANGYYKRSDLDLMLSGSQSKIDELVKQIKL
jgi:uncharacterized radical SAM superfamily Fe-S cluster-containing enzyme